MPEAQGTPEGAEAIARSALTEIAPDGTVGTLVSTKTPEDGVLELNFASSLSGYVGWHWSVSLAQLADQDPTVLEVGLMPGDGALLAPEWVPWVDRLEEYRAAQAAAAAEAGETVPEGDDVEGLDDDDVDVDELLDDDAGDDPDDGIDFESDEALALSASGVDEQDEPEYESDDDGPEQPDET